MNKYNAKKTEVNGITFASKKEAQRYLELLMLERSGEIRCLQLQPVFELIPKQPGERASRYTADFMYLEYGKWIVEDVKSPATRKKPDYVLRRKLFKLKYGCGYEFREV